ncbi:unnamed protein product [Arctia plantaginis]|uniref:Kazal-like domain-containing protein n=1 Tax=Arctia plantaginis TaxID=874455 RepID=A0A8S0ZPN2_ARCPL|nr:unnamed protein product [Arctia plantaginis]CAB3238299.1 unnamed protein product [Arctia plantaginis]
MSLKKHILVGLFSCILVMGAAHGPPKDRDNEDVAMGRKSGCRRRFDDTSDFGARKQMGAKWCSMAKVCNHDRVPICGLSHAGDIIGFRDLCDMFDYNCIRRRNYKQTSCPDDKTLLTVSRRPTSSYFDD